MVNWLKYFFGGFFLHKLSLENERRNLFNALLALALSFVLFLVGLYAGYVASFSTHLNNSSQFENTVKQVFGKDGVKLVVKDGIATSVGNARPIDTFGGVGTAPDTDMQVVVDTNPTDQNYAEFEAYCILNGDDNSEITYADYLNLTEEQQAKYSFAIRYTGKPLVIDEQKIEIYNAHLQAASNKQSPFYKVEIAADYAALSQDDADYESKLYELYVASYYPTLSSFERFVAAPSMKTYYTQQIAEAEQYFVILDDMCFGRFVADNGAAVEFSGFFVNIDNRVLDGSTQTDEQLIENATTLVCYAFGASKSNVMSVYVINAVSSFPIIVVAEFIVALAAWFAIKKSHGEFGFGACVKTVFLYFFVASLLMFVLCFGLSFALSREIVYTIFVVGLFATVLVRSAVFCVTECVRSLHRYRAEHETEQQDSSETPVE